jgi:hypothetical protein
MAPDDQGNLWLAGKAMGSIVLMSLSQADGQLGFHQLFVKVASSDYDISEVTTDSRGRAWVIGMCDPGAGRDLALWRFE